MKNLLLKLFTSAAIKNGVAVAFQVVSMTVDALRGILMADGLSDERRRQIQIVFNAMIAVREFLSRLSTLIGAPASSTISSLEHLSDKASKLGEITEKL